jgi:Flp pilus assembly protein TadG
MLNRHVRHLRDGTGVAALEFGLCAPLLSLFVMALVDIAKGLILWEQVNNTARAIALSATTIAIQPDLSSSLTVAQAQQAMSAIYAEMPWLRSGIEQGKRSVTLSAITFVPSPASCVPTASDTCGTWSPAIAWSVAYQGGYNSGTAQYDSFFQANQLTRSCQTAPVQVSPSATANSPLTVVRTLNVTQPEPILVADVHYQYKPLFYKFVTGKLDFWSSSYYPSRSINTTATPAYQYTKYDIANQANGAGKCSGWT